MTARGLGPGVAIIAALVALVIVAPSLFPGDAPQHLLVADLRGHVLVQLDPAHPEAATSIALPGGPHELLRLADGRVAVTLEQAGSLALVDLATGAVEAVDVGGIPHGIAQTEDGTLLVTDRSIDAVRRFRLDPWTELDPIGVDHWPHAVEALSDGRIASTGAEPGSIRIGATGVATGAFTESLAVSPDGTFLASAATSDRVTLLDAGTGAVVASLEVAGRPVRVRFSPDGQTLAVALSAGGAVALLNVSDLVAGLTVSPQVVAVAGVPDGLAFADGGRTLYASDVYGGAVTAIDLAGEAPRRAAVIPVGASTGALLALAR